MISRFLIAWCLLCVTLSISALTSGNVEVPNSPEGFDRQYQPLFSSWAKSDKRKLQASLQDFALPSTWFVETFGSDEGPEMAKLYSDQFEDFKTHISRNFQMAAEFGRSFAEKKYGSREAQMFLETKLNQTAEPKPTPKPPPDSLQPLPVMQKFSTESFVHVRDGNKQISAWMDSFVYIDGKFRFLGRGAYPFWDAARIRMADPCAKPGEQTGGKLTKKVEPEYPDEAKAQHIEGFVKARLTIATDGTVKAVEITDGPSALQAAARKAFAQWQYTPFMNCGKTVEMRSSMEHIKFSLP